MSLFLVCPSRGHNVVLVERTLGLCIFVLERTFPCSAGKTGMWLSFPPVERRLEFPVMERRGGSGPLSWRGGSGSSLSRILENYYRNNQATRYLHFLLVRDLLTC